jgi:F-type H+-transporting ATPase subunit delta
VSLHAVARRYAVALFDVVKKNQTMDAAHAALTGFAAVVAGSDELQQVFASPSVPAAKKAAVAAALAGQAGLPDEVRRLVAALAERDRLTLIADVARAFDARVMQERHVLDAQVTTAVALSPERTQALADALGKAAGGTVKITATVDPSIVGGVVARVGSTVYDGSVTRQLERLKSQLINSQSK